jgi:hypothetical protein
MPKKPKNTALKGYISRNYPNLQAGKALPSANLQL